MAAGNGPARIARRCRHGDAGGGHPAGAQHHRARLVFRRQADPPRSHVAVGFSEYEPVAYRRGRGDTWNIIRVVLVEHGPLVRARRRILTTIGQGVLLGAGGTVFCLMLLGAAGPWRSGRAGPTVEPAPGAYPYRPPLAWGGAGDAQRWSRPGRGRAAGDPGGGDRRRGEVCYARRLPQAGDCRRPRSGRGGTPTGPPGCRPGGRRGSGRCGHRTNPGERRGEARAGAGLQAAQAGLRTAARERSLKQRRQDISQAADPRAPEAGRRWGLVLRTPSRSFDRNDEGLDAFALPSSFPVSRTASQIPDDVRRLRHVARLPGPRDPPAISVNLDATPFARQGVHP